MVRMWRALQLRLRWGRRDAGASGAGQARGGGALPLLAEDVLGQEGEDGLVPDPRVAGVRIQWFSSGK